MIFHLMRKKTNHKHGKKIEYMMRLFLSQAVK